MWARKCVRGAENDGGAMEEQEQQTEKSVDAANISDRTPEQRAVPVPTAHLDLSVDIHWAKRSRPVTEYNIHLCLSIFWCLIQWFLKRFTSIFK